MKNGDTPAIGHAGRTDMNGFADAPGLTKREMFAAMAMQGMLSGVLSSESTAQAACQLSVERGHQHYSGLLAVASLKYADALLAELDRPA